MEDAQQRFELQKLGLLAGHMAAPFLFNRLFVRLLQLGMLSCLSLRVQNASSIAVTGGIHVFSIFVASLFTVPLQQYATPSYIYILNSGGHDVITGVAVKCSIFTDPLTTMTMINNIDTQNNNRQTILVRVIYY
jgi:hypothetical protein